MEAISVGCHIKIWSLDKLWKSQVFREPHKLIDDKQDSTWNCKTMI